MSEGKNKNKQKLPDYSKFLKDEDILVNDDGEQYVYVNALVRIAREHAGLKGWDVHVVQAPERTNNWSATVEVKVYFEDGTFFSDAADCRIDTARQGYHHYTTALASTRALGRALRRALNIELCTVEEVKDGTGPATDLQKKFINEKILKSGVFGLKDVSRIVGRKITNLKMLSQKEAAKIIEEYNSRLTKKQLKEG